MIDRSATTASFSGGEARREALTAEYFMAETACLSDSMTASWCIVSWDTGALI